MVLEMVERFIPRSLSSSGKSLSPKTDRRKLMQDAEMERQLLDGWRILAGEEPGVLAR